MVWVEIGVLVIVRVPVDIVGLLAHVHGAKRVADDRKDPCRQSEQTHAEEGLGGEPEKVCSGSDGG